MATKRKIKGALYGGGGRTAGSRLSHTEAPTIRVTPRSGPPPAPPPIILRGGRRKFWLLLKPNIGPFKRYRKHRCPERICIVHKLMDADQCLHHPLDAVHKTWHNQRRRFSVTGGLAIRTGSCYPAVRLHPPVPCYCFLLAPNSLSRFCRSAAASRRAPKILRKPQRTRFVPTTPRARARPIKAAKEWGERPTQGESCKRRHKQVLGLLRQELMPLFWGWRRRF